MTLVGEKFVPVEECAELAGTTEQTIKQYVSVGLLESDDDGQVNLKQASKLLFFQCKEDQAQPAEPKNSQQPEIQSLLLTQLVELKEERDWLKERIERLEATVERTQILAIADKPRKPRWKSLLPNFSKSTN